MELFNFPSRFRFKFYIIYGRFTHVISDNIFRSVISYNSIENIPVAVDNPRPSFIASRDYTAIKPLTDQALNEI